MSFAPGTVTSVYVRSIRHHQITMWSTPLPISSDDGLDICMPLTVSFLEYLVLFLRHYHAIHLYFMKTQLQ